MFQSLSNLEGADFGRKCSYSISSSDPFLPLPRYLIVSAIPCAVVPILEGRLSHCILVFAKMAPITVANFEL
jgi:hypothetical protein